MKKLNLRDFDVYCEYMTGFPKDYKENEKRMDKLIKDYKRINSMTKIIKVRR